MRQACRIRQSFRINISDMCYRTVFMAVETNGIYYNWWPQFSSGVFSSKDEVISLKSSNGVDGG